MSAFDAAEGGGLSLISGTPRRSPEDGRQGGRAMRQGWLQVCLRQKESEILAAAVERNHWNVSATARELGVSRVGLSNRLKALGIRRPPKQPRYHRSVKRPAWPCPKCEARAGEPCRELGMEARRARSPHVERREPPAGQAVTLLETEAVEAEQ